MLEEKKSLTEKKPVLICSMFSLVVVSFLYQKNLSFVCVKNQARL